MSTQTPLAPLFETFFRDRLARQRNATPATIASYRDALRMLLLFAAARRGHKPHRLGLSDLDRDVVLGYLDHLEHVRGNGVHTRNSRLTAIRSFFHHPLHEARSPTPSAPHESLRSRTTAEIDGVPSCSSERTEEAYAIERRY